MAARRWSPRWRVAGLEDAAVLLACSIVAVIINWRLLHPDVFEGDAFVHQYWMWHWRDPQLFNDPLTHQLRESARYPWGYQALFWVGTQLTSPIVFGEWLGTALMAVSGWLIFRIARENATWRPAAWMAAAFFLSLYDIHRFSGGFSRAFVQPIVLVTVLLILRRRPWIAALVAGGGALFYPPAAVLAVGVVIVCALRWKDGRPALDRQAAGAAVVAGVVALIAVLGPQLLAGSDPAVLSASEARSFPEFEPGGTLHFFANSLIEYLRQNRSGFDLRVSGGIITLAALALLVVRPRNVRLLRWPVVAMPIVSLGAYAVAQVVLFRLYLPHRYTYPLISFFAIVVGVALRPTWTALWARRRPWLPAFALLSAPLVIAALAVYVFPLGPMQPLKGLGTTTTAVVAVCTVVVAAAAVFALTRVPVSTRPIVAALLSGATLLGVLIVVPDHPAAGWTCPRGPAIRFLASLPKDAIIAGDPLDMNCLPGTTRRAVVISTQLAPSYESAYFRMGRTRMFDTLRAYYDPSVDALLKLRDRYGATDLWVRRGAVQAEVDGTGRWSRHPQPYRSFVAQLVRSGQEPAVLHLPASCRRFKDGANEVYDLSCVADQAAR